MTQRVQELITALTDNDRTVENLLHLLEQEQQNIARLQGERVEESAERVRELVTQLEGAASAIRRLLAGVARETGLPDGTTLSGIIPRLPPHQSVPLEKLRTRLLENGRQVNRLLEINQELLSGGLQAVTSALDFFKSIMTRRTTYGEQGKLLGGADGVRLVNREA